MSLSDAIAIYAAVVATLTGWAQIRGGWPRVRATAGDMAIPSGNGPPGQKLQVRWRNVGAVPTVVDHVVPAVIHPWFPTSLIALFAKFRWVPLISSQGGAYGCSCSGPGLLEPHAEVNTTVELWPEHLELIRKLC